MKAARLVGPQRLEIGEHPAPKPQKGEGGLISAPLFKNVKK